MQKDRFFERPGKNIASMSMVGRLGQVLLVLSFASLSSGQLGDLRLRSAANKPSDRIVNLPFFAQRRFTSVEKRTNGGTSSSESGGSEARDSEGRTYTAGERHWTYIENGKSVVGSEMLYRVNDPVKHATTSWDSTSRVAKVVQWSGESPQGALDLSGFDSEGGVEKIGSKEIGGIAAEGTRSSYDVPAGRVIHEVWYSPALKIVVLETNEDPRRGSWRNELVNITRGQPDERLFSPPKEYVIKEIRLPIQWPGSRAKP